MARAVVTEAKPATEPTERSISPQDNTKVIATAIIAIMAVCLPIFSILFVLRKPLSYKVIEKN